MLQPLGQVSVSGTVGADGTSTIVANKLRSPNMWQLLTFTGQQVDPATGKVVGNPDWSVQFDTSDIKFGHGARTEIGPFIVPLNTVPSVVVTGGQNGANIIGSFMGTYSNDFREVVANFVPVPNPPSIGVTSPGQTQLANQTLAANADTVLTAALIPGMHGIAILGQVASLGNSFLKLTSVIGNDTGAAYFSNSVGLNLNAMTVVPVVVPQPQIDKTVAITIHNGSIATNYAVWVFAVFDVEAMDIYSNGGTTVQTLADVTDRTARRLGHVELTNASDVEIGTVVSPLFVQHGTAFVAAEPAAVGNTTMVAAVANQNVYIFGWHLSYDQNPGGLAAYFLNDTVAAAAGRIAGIVGGLAQDHTDGYRGGTPLPVSRGLIVEAAAVGGVGTTGRAYVSYSQF